MDKYIDEIFELIRELQIHPRDEISLIGKSLKFHWFQHLENWNWYKPNKIINQRAGKVKDIKLGEEIREIHNYLMKGNK